MDTHVNLFRDAANIGVNKLVFHPPPGLSFEDEPMKRRLAALSALQEEYGIQVMLENMARVIRPPGFRQLFPFHPDVTDPVKVDRAAFVFGLSTTFDTSHAYLPEPHNQEWFKEIFPRIGNIHLSSFYGKVDHLPLNMGDFRSEEFLIYLKKAKYSGLITLEVFHPRRAALKNPDLKVIKDSIDVVKSLR